MTDESSVMHSPRAHTYASFDLTLTVCTLLNIAVAPNAVDSSPKHRRLTPAV